MWYWSLKSLVFLTCISSPSKFAQKPMAWRFLMTPT